MKRPKSEQAPRHQLPLLLPDHLEIREIHQVQEIGRGDVVDFRLPAACSLNSFAELQDRLPQMGIVGDDDPRRRRAQLMHQLQRVVDILEHADGVGDHDVVERSFDRSQRRRILRVAQDKMQIGMQRCSLGDSLRAEIDADAVVTAPAQQANPRGRSPIPAPACRAESETA